MRNLSGLRRTLLLLIAFALVLSSSADRSMRPAAAAPPSFSFNWNGTPVGPQPWSPGLINDWDLIVHNRDHQNSMYMVNAGHGANCGAFPATHQVSQFQDSVFICNNHMMTALNGGGYSEIVMTPSKLLDFSSGGTVQVSISTAKTDNRDWLDFWISPFAENLLLPSGGIPPDLQGPTKDAVMVQIDSSIPTTGHVQEFQNYATTEFRGTGMSVESCVAPLGGVSMTRRDPFLLTMSRTHVRLDVIVNGTPCTLVDTNINDPGFGLGVVQIGHHSYAPDEGTMCNIPGCLVNTGAGAGNTWHWSNFSMSPAVPFTMLRGDMPLSGVTASNPTVHFGGAAPANSFLRFSGLAKRGSIQISADGGPFFAAQEQLQNGDGKDGVSDGSHIGYWTPIPAGTTSVTYKAVDSTQPWTIQDVAIWSSDQASIIPIPVPPSGGGGGGGSTGGSGGGSTGGAGSSGDGAGSVTGGGSSGEPGTQPGGGGGNPLEGPAGGGSTPPKPGGGGSTGQPRTADGGPAAEPNRDGSSTHGPGILSPAGAAVTVRDEVAAVARRQGIPTYVAWAGLLLALLVVFGALAIGLRRRALMGRRPARRRSRT